MDGRGKGKWASGVCSGKGEVGHGETGRDGCKGTMAVGGGKGGVDNKGGKGKSGEGDGDDRRWFLEGAWIHWTVCQAAEGTANGTHD